MIFVYKTDGSLASLFSDNGTTAISQPLRTDSLGYFEFYVADGLYNLTISYGGKIQITLSRVQIYDESQLQGGTADLPDGTRIAELPIAAMNKALNAAGQLTQFIKNYSNNSME
ncbi:MAG: carboxypeptidase regulatory-like domain-containing protein [Zymomonas mobilis]|uniref:Uncharacterized protein n=1 Tax=Zymomonas mobilis TaxID=542 RepID=A0A542VZZ9_ZYMMB|nr:carboxypeptidase regulatory-like domain-containing protein [Zymomonas mobilis]TQL16890.1 hypothetical protein FBY58_0440 [Zymomonas mobilis]